MKKLQLFFLNALFFILSPQPGNSVLLTDIRLESSYNTDAALNRSNLIKALPKSDYSNNLSLGLSRNNPFSLYDSLSIAYRFESAEFRELRSQNAWNHLFEIKYQSAVNEKLTLVPALEYEYHDENNQDWSYSRYNPSVLFTYFADQGLITEVFYEWNNKQFLNNQDKTNYYNIGSNNHNLDVRFKSWHNSFLRSTLSYNYDNEIFEPTNFTALLYTGLSSGFIRNDKTHSVGFEEMILISNNLMGNLMYEYQDNQSNADIYFFRSNRLGTNIILEPIPSHNLFLEWNYTLYDYYKNHFDKRYTNTREDFKTDLIAIYKIEINQRFTFQMKYNFNNNDSNDSIDYNSAFSKSYSNYSRNIFSIALRIYL